MTTPLINRTFRPNPNNMNSAAGPVPQGATVPTASGGGQWSPTVANLLVLIIVEMAAYAALTYLINKVV